MAFPIAVVGVVGVGIVGAVGAIVAHSDYSDYSDHSDYSDAAEKRKKEIEFKIRNEENNFKLSEERLKETLIFLSESLQGQYPEKRYLFDNLNLSNINLSYADFDTDFKKLDKPVQLAIKNAANDVFEQEIAEKEAELQALNDLIMKVSKMQLTGIKYE